MKKNNNKEKKVTTQQNESFKCPDCGASVLMEDLDFQLKEEASLTCPVCGSVFEISALLTKPGTTGEESPEEITPFEKEITPNEETSEEESPAGTEIAPEENMPPQIAPKESVESRVDGALDSLKAGKDAKDVLSALVGKDSLKEGSKYVDITPSPSQYRHMLLLLIKHVPDKATRDWAKDELKRVKHLEMWRTPREISPVPKLPSMPGHEPEEEPEEEPTIKDLMNFEPGSEEREELESKKALKEKKDEKSWEGDFAAFHAKLFGVSEDLEIAVDEYEKVILALQEKEAIELNKNLVKLDLKKAKECLVDFLKDKVKDAGIQADATRDLTQPPPVAPDLGNAPPEAAPPEGAIGGPLASEDVTEEDEGEKEVKDDIEMKVELALSKFFE